MRHYIYRGRSEQPTRPTRTSLALGTAVLALALSAPLASAAESGGVPQALNTVNATLNALINTVNGLVASVNRLVASTTAPGSTVLVTPPLIAANEVACQVVYTGATKANVTITLSTGYNTPDTRVYTIDPSSRVAIFLGPGQQASSYCQFSADVPLSQLRANIAAFSPGRNSTVASANAY